MHKGLLACIFSFAVLSISCKKKIVDLVNPGSGGTAVAASYFVSPTGDDNNNGTAASTPFKTIQKAANSVLPGDVVSLMNGTYNSASINITRSGTSDKYITFKAFPGHSPKIFAINIWNALIINGSYIIIEGIELEGNNTNLTYNGAYAAYTAHAAGGPALPAYNTNGISIGGPAGESKMPHHIIIRNCKVHDFPGGGISSIQADYTTIEGNIVYNNAWYMVYAGSGISILNPFNSDGVTTYKNIVRNNIVYSNKTTIPWISLTPNRLSDGNGIIIDVNTRPYGSNTSTNPYNGRTLVENNVSYNNGGSGIHCFDAKHVDIINNTAFNNGQVVGYAEIFSNKCTDVKIINNIMYGRTGGACNSNFNNTNVTYDYNIYFNGTTSIKGTNDKVVDPQFVMLSTNPAVANFSVNMTSPAIDAGTSTIFSAKDILGVTRPKGAGVDCGAYEVK